MSLVLFVTGVVNGLPVAGAGALCRLHGVRIDDPGLLVLLR